MASPPKLQFSFLTYGLDRPVFGISRSVLELGSALARRADCRPTFFTPYRSGPFTDRQHHHIALRGARLLPALLTLGAVELAWLAREHRLPLIHDPTGVAPFLVPRRLAPYKCVVTIHDVTPFRYPESHTALTRFVHRAYLPSVLRHVDLVITDSEASRDDINHFLRVPKERINVVPLAVAPEFHVMDKHDAVTVARLYGLRQPYILYVGALQPRKNLPRLLRAFAQVHQRRPDITLAIAGKPAWKFAEIPRTLDELGLGKAVQFTGYVSEKDLPALYGAAAVSCYPSLYEGFGLPVLEAMACGTPVVASNSSSIPEIAGDAALLVDPLDVHSLANAICRVLDDAHLVDDLRSSGLRRTALYVWDNAASSCRTAYLDALSH